MNNLREILREALADNRLAGLPDPSWCHVTFEKLRKMIEAAKEKDAEERTIESYLTLRHLQKALRLKHEKQKS